MPVIRSASETVTTTTYRIFGKEILALIPEPILSTDAVTVEFYVPSGGDYSGVALPVTEKDPVIVTLKRWTKEEETA